jgi:hypothetical protein
MASRWRTGPLERLGWNWKSALVSATCRAALFCAMNASAGLGPAARAMAVEFCFRAVASGYLGRLTQRLCHVRPRWLPLACLPILGHLGEFLVHSTAGTPRLGASIVASVAFSVLTTAFNLFVMRRGVLIVGAGQQSLAADLRLLPRLIVTFLCAWLPQRRRPGRFLDAA